MLLNNNNNFDGLCVIAMGIYSNEKGCCLVNANNSSYYIADLGAVLYSDWIIQYETALHENGSILKSKTFEQNKKEKKTNAKLFIAI